MRQYQIKAELEEGEEAGEEGGRRRDQRVGNTAVGQTETTTGRWR